ncbi:MAG: aldo/keto reductase [Bacillota bacterium]|nr:4Fe-4S dicluster domain-containing protein [Bacillota bacterium]HOB91023.1 aldo/keto reductase [Bacillota bacterium]HPZ54149.1 aldo/keto reductase [Bacillota bacterium]HQD18071.1 aldo/keto reductase [Bacillota bacterium]
MEYRKLGNTGISVSRLCFGLLTLSGLQRGLDVREGVSLLKKALDLGVTFFDTAVLYETDEVLNRFLRDVRRDSIVIASKSYDYDYESMRKTVMGVLSRLETPYIDLFLLHEQESRLTLKGHAGALDCLRDLKAEGLVRAIGVSTHYVDVVRACALNPVVDVVHPIYNWKGIGVQGGSVEEMRDAIQFARDMGLGVYAMKALGGGHLTNDAASALRHVLDFQAVDSVAVGMADVRELEFNIAVFEGRGVDSESAQSLVRGKALHVADYCRGCGRCVSRCGYGALRLQDGRATVDSKACVLCGYCASVCPDFCLKVY